MPEGRISRLPGQVCAVRNIPGRRTEKIYRERRWKKGIKQESLFTRGGARAFRREIGGGSGFSRGFVYVWAAVVRVQIYFLCIYSRSFAPTWDRSTRFSVTNVELGNDLARGDKTVAITLLESRYATRSWKSVRDTADNVALMTRMAVSDSTD